MIKFNKKDILFCFLILLGTIATLRMPYIENGDELWTFANTYKLNNGISLYGQNNVIVTPLFFWIGCALFKLLGATFLTYRIYNVILIFTLFCAIYYLLKKCKINQNISIILTLILMFGSKIINGPSYTILAIIFFIIGITELIKNKEKKVNVIFQGIIIFLIFMSKQNIGIYYAISIFIYLLTKEDKIKNIIKIGIVVIIPMFMFLGYEYYKGELFNFINYAFLGISEFAQKNIIIEQYTPTLVLIALQIVSIIVAIYQMKENRKQNINDEILKILFIFSFGNMLLEYPIFNLYHVTIASIVSYILLIYILYGNIIKIQLKKEEQEILNKIIKNIIIILLIISIVLTGTYIFKVIKEFSETEKEYTANEPFFGGILSKSETEYDEVMQFIKDKEKNGMEVIIFDSRANIYMVPLNKNNQNYDLPMLGNWGKNGENKVLEDVQNKTNTYFLMYKEEKNITTQESTKIKDYIKNNSVYEGKIGKYEIFKKI